MEVGETYEVNMVTFLQLTCYTLESHFIQSSNPISLIGPLAPLFCRSLWHCQPVPKSFL
jgi:hypothetical protein